MGCVELGELELAPDRLAAGLVARPPARPRGRAAPACVGPTRSAFSASIRASSRASRPAGLPRISCRRSGSWSRRSSSIASRSAGPSTSKKGSRPAASACSRSRRSPIVSQLPIQSSSKGPSQQRLGPFAQAPRGGAGGADHEHPLGRGPVGRQPRQPPRQQLGLAGPGGAEHQQRAVAVGDRPLASTRLHSRRRLLLAHRPTLARRSIRPMDVFSADWLGICRRAVAAQRAIFAATASSEERTVYEGVGEGGDRTLGDRPPLRGRRLRRARDAGRAGRLLRRRLRGARRGRVRRRRRGPGRDRPDRRLAQRPPHDPLAQPQHRRRLRRLDGRRRVRLRPRLRRRRGVRRPPRRGRAARRPRRPGRRRGREAGGGRPRVGRAGVVAAGPARRWRARPTACGWSARSRSPPPMSPPAASTRC